MTADSPFFETMPKAIRSSVTSAFFFRALRAAYGLGRGEPLSFGKFALATVVQAGAHGAMASCAGLLGQTLVRRQFGAASTLVDSLRFDFSPLLLCAVGFAAALTKTLAGAAATYEQKRAAFRVADEVRREIAQAVLASGRASASATHTHALIAVRLREIERAADEGVLSAIRAAAQLVPMAAVLIVFSSRLALAAFAVLASFALLLSLLRRRLRRAHARASALAERLHTSLDELLRHLDLWRTYGASNRVLRALAAAGDRAGQAAARADAAKTAISGGNEALAALSLLLAVAVVEHGKLALDRGPLVAFAAVFFLMYRPLRDLGDARVHLERGAQAQDELERVRASVRGDTGVHSAVSKPDTAAWGVEKLAVRKLTVSLGEYATPETDVDAEPGEIVALVGRTGVGKSSLLRALLGLDRNIAGEVRYGDRDLTRAGVGPGERPFAWVPQEAAIVAGTLADNVALGAPADADPREVAAAALDAIGAQALAARLDEVLSAGGPELSGGERQWIAIARACATGLPVLVLDEPTSGLDDDAQRRVLDALSALRGRRTVVLVTHRPEPLDIADRIVRM